MDKTSAGNLVMISSPNFLLFMCHDRDIDNFVSFANGNFQL